MNDITNPTRTISTTNPTYTIRVSGLYSSPARTHSSGTGFIWNSPRLFNSGR